MRGERAWPRTNDVGNDPEGDWGKKKLLEGPRGGKVHPRVKKDPRGSNAIRRIRPAALMRTKRGCSSTRTERERNVTKLIPYQVTRKDWGGKVVGDNHQRKKTRPLRAKAREKSDGAGRGGKQYSQTTCFVGGNGRGSLKNAFRAEAPKRSCRELLSPPKQLKKIK